MADRDKRKRRSYSKAFKRRVVAETLEPGASVAAVARRHGLNANMVFLWRRDPRFGPGWDATTVLPVEVKPAETPSSPEPFSADEAGEIEITLASGHRLMLSEVPLFAGFRRGRGTDSISAKLNKAIRAAGVPHSPRLVAYSYRHTVKEALRSAGTPDHVQRRLLGHAGQGVADRYGSPAGRLAEAKEALESATPHLGDVDDSIYSALERLK